MEPSVFADLSPSVRLTGAGQVAGYTLVFWLVPVHSRKTVQLNKFLLRNDAIQPATAVPLIMTSVSHSMYFCLLSM